MYQKEKWNRYIPKKTTECIKNTALFLYFSTKTHQRWKYTKENVCFNIYPAMSVSEARRTMKARLETTKGNVRNKIHVQFNV